MLFQYLYMIDIEDPRNCLSIEYKVVPWGSLGHAPHQSAIILIEIGYVLVCILNPDNTPGIDRFTLLR